jgi:hypothetical protein
MANYTITVAGSNTLTIGTGEKNDSLSISLIGKNYPNYGQLIQQNLVNMMQNFAGANAPSNPKLGQLYYKTGTFLQVFDGVNFRNVTTVYSSSSAPSSIYTVVQGDLWYDTGDNQLKIYTGTGWLIVGPVYTSTQGVTFANAWTINDDALTPRTVLSFWVNNALEGIMSASTEFTPQNNYPGFPTIKPGLNLKTGTTASGITGYVFSNSQPYINSLGVLTGLSVSGTANINVLNAASIGNSGTVLYGTLNASSAAQTNITSLGTLSGLGVSGTSYFNIANVTTLGSNANAMSLTSSIIPSQTNLLGLGNATYRFSGIHAANVYATSSTAQYADLAERYVGPPEGLPANSIVVLAGPAEVNISDVSHDHRVLGIVSENPAFLMNYDDGNGGNQLGTAIALTGRVPCMVTGPIAQGDLIVNSDQAGVGIKLDPEKFQHGCIVGKALSGIDDDSTQIIEVAVGIK